MIELADILPSALPAAVAWAEAEAARGLAQGAPLTLGQADDARTVGVAQPERIRVMTVERMPFPDTPTLAAIARDTGLLSPGTIGLTLGHAVYVLRGQDTRRLLTHEFRHVHQYEAAGSIGAFLARYLHEIATVGYHDAPLEADARQHEFD
ncbi:MULTISPECIES: hypothetical protein [Burkholderia]|uniref:DUF4157 domain-containing protein n=1 Tax=Burkholderia sola TaxID=2843302 RepID=A0ABV2C341_9BURK|nr:MULTISPECIES: hypothetical protein [unclassified Burkholderia]RQV62970.1 hypothetical protein DF024_15965 [Burkholderia cenocepacia]MBP0605592.1 hypothetical protein [Burkholderia sp. CpTa8-5]MBP0712466.1 hypothetical protein [Burkholderia sp. AcTa6-5]QRR17036.1 hypothetical protein GJG85_27310 [Burkholderia sp. MS389]CAG2311006.1 hypothetical protein BCCR75389_03589 [Burkholderia cenocepacia]